MTTKTGALVILVTECLLAILVFVTLAYRLLVQHAAWDTTTVGLLGLLLGLLGLLSPGPHAAKTDAPEALSSVLSSVVDRGQGVTATVEPTDTGTDPYPGDSGHTELDTVLLVATFVGVLLLLLGVTLR